MATRKALTLGPDGLPRLLQAGDTIDRTGDVAAADNYVQTPANGTYPLTAKARTALTYGGIDGLKTSGGTLTMTISINGTPVTGLSGIGSAACSWHLPSQP